MIRSIRVLARSWTLTLVLLSLVAASCGGSDDDIAGNESGSVSSAATELARENSDADLSDSATTTATPTTSGVTTTVAASAPTTVTASAVPSSVASTDADCPAWDGPRGQSTLTFRHRDVDRAVVVHVPDGSDLTTPMPVVFNFHGLGGRAESQMASTQFGPLADRDGWLVIAADGVLSPRRWPIEGIDADGPASLEFVDALIEWTALSWCIDRNRLYATGFSYGGLMTSALACQRPTTFAAFAPVGLTTHNPSICLHDEPVSLLSFHGTADAVVPFDGSPTFLDPDGAIGNIADNTATWASQGGCDAETTEQVVEAPTTLRSWSCPDGVEVGIHIIEGGAHEWPRAAAAGVDATPIIWDFFGRHARS